jgi:hypothetical protein
MVVKEKQIFEVKNGLAYHTTGLTSDVELSRIGIFGADGIFCDAFVLALKSTF